jgi:hypothetical protein
MRRLVQKYGLWMQFVWWNDMLVRYFMAPGGYSSLGLQ